MKPYARYKPSTIDWLGDVPEHWDILRTKYCFDLVTEKADDNNSEILLSIYTDIGVRPRSELEERGNKATTTDGYWVVKKGDIIVNKLLAWMGAIGISKYSGVTSPAYDILRAKSHCNSNFYSYLFRNEIMFSEFRRNSRGIMDMRLRLYFSEFGNIQLPVPPLPEQTAIADFLDRKTAQIDRLIEHKRALLSKLAEKRTALISHAVTKGLNPDAPLRPSEIAWLGDVPEHWEVKRLKNVASYNDEQLVEQTDPDTEIQYVDISSVSLINGIEATETLKFEEAPSRARRKVQNGDVIISTVRTYLKAITQIKKPPENMIVSTGFAVIRPQKNFNPDFAGYFLQSNGFIDDVVARSVGVSYPAINASELVKIPIALPPLTEQTAIADYLDQATTRIDRQSQTIQTAIEKLGEYRSALISQAVTGKIDVRDAV